MQDPCTCNMASIGRTTHAPGTAGAHLRYISRRSANPVVIAEHMPADRKAARVWMNRHERAARKNARLCDKIMIALPRELDAQQRAALVRDYVRRLTNGHDLPWFAAIHQSGGDTHNPHAHIVIVDKDVKSGKRVLCFSDSPRDRQKKGLPGPKAVEWVREQWEMAANDALAAAGHDARIDRRSLVAQGIERIPQIHIGPRAQHIDTRVRRPVSKEVPSPTARYPDRVIDYPMIDAGRSRRERNDEIIDLNLERARFSKDFDTRTWAHFERDQRAKDRPLEALLISRARRRSIEAKRLRVRFRERREDVLTRQRAEAALARGWLAQRDAPQIEALRKRHEAERDELAQQHGAFFSRFVSMLDITGGARRRRDADRRALAKRQRDERKALAERIKAARETHRKAVEARYAVQLAEVAQARGKALQSLTARHRAEEAEDEQAFCVRQAERERERRAVEAQIESVRAGPRIASSQKDLTGENVPDPPIDKPNKWVPGKKPPRRTKRTNTRRTPHPPDDQPRPDA